MHTSHEKTDTDFSESLSPPTPNGGVLFCVPFLRRNLEDCGKSSTFAM